MVVLQKNKFGLSIDKFFDRVIQISRNSAINFIYNAYYLK